MHFLYLNNNTAIHYTLIEGKETKPCLIFLHEGLGCVEMWKSFPYKLCKATGNPGLIYDRKGYGKSSPFTEERTVDYLEKAALAELVEIVEQILNNRKYFLIGHSDGGSIALIHGARYSKNLLGIIVEAAHVFVEEITLQGIQAANEYFDLHGPGGLTKYHGDKTQSIFKAWSETWLQSDFRDWNIEHYLSQINRPTLILQGADDQYGSQKQVDIIASRVSGQTEYHILPSCGHTPHREAEHKTLELMTTFINSVIDRA